MSELAFTVVSDGSSDTMLLPVLTWLLAQHLVHPFRAQWADLRKLRDPPRRLDERVRVAVDLYPCDLLFIHRDAEREDRQVRVDEIQRSVTRLDPMVTRWVPVVPVRMQEAWFLFHEPSLREAAGNPSGSAEIALPRMDRVERIPDAKAVLEELIRNASGLHGRRLSKFRMGPAKHRLASLVTDFSPLRVLPAFVALETELKDAIQSRGWQQHTP